MIINESNIDKCLDSSCSFSMQAALEEEPKTTESLPENASAEADWTGISVQEDEVSAVLWERWIACYMLYDWNFRHADAAYDSNKCAWIEQVYKRLEGVAMENEPEDGASEKAATDTFNQILLEDVEDFIQTHMRVWKCDRLTVEMEVARVEAELFSGQAT